MDNQPNEELLKYLKNLEEYYMEREQTITDDILNTDTLLKVPIIVSDKFDKPCLELRRQNISNVEFMKQIISAALNGTSITIYPSFTDMHRSINTLIQKGIIYYNKDTKEYYYVL